VWAWAAITFCRIGDGVISRFCGISSSFDQLGGCAVMVLRPRGAANLVALCREASCLVALCLFPSAKHADTQTLYPSQSDF
jgi:hypothetical protein